MKRNIFKAGFIAALLTATSGFAQEGKLDNLKPRDQRGLTVFENPKDTVSTFDHLRVKVGGAFALQFQGIKHENNATPVIVNGVNTTQLYNIGNNINLPTANLDLDVALYDGVNLHLRTFLSSRHHNETYVKGGYLQIDKLDFIQKGFAEELMKYTTIKVGQDQINYGDAQLRRTDNAYAILNPFVGNYLMDAYATFPFAELYYRRNGVIVMGGVTNGKLNQTATGGTSPGIYGKLGYDKQINQDLRIRLTGSVYNIARAPRLDFYNGDRAGSRYYFVMENTAATSSAQMRSGMVDPDFANSMTSLMINPFLKYKGLEFFGIFESASGRNLVETDRRTYNQYAAELLYRFGNTENFYFGGRYNKVDGKLITGDDISVDRYNIGGGWFMTKNILTKIEYVNQKYDGYPATNIRRDGKFNGFMLEAVISF
ncbi:MAG: hypothetical protein K0R77_358 [Chryseobacterium sp.]|jgi:hypothetical protein|uniref:hypothetical protein n=1 Tax=Chryseobacterium sp. TaxID=1871047 RepID=UPI002632FA3D|nr:hypothetical protein [Chryseobacterium sp.]MDF2551083.1 hypothetical protein [Chryseobacterium sp.]